jgi:hypothetical protein
VGLPSDVNAIRWDKGKLAETEAALEPELHGQFRSLVESTHFHASKRGWHPIRQYAVLADLVREGWRGPPCSRGNSP